MRNLSFLLFLGLLLTGCKLERLQEASGKYFGKMNLNGNEDTIILELPYLKHQNLDDQILLKFSSVTNLSRVYEVNFTLEKKGILLSSPSLGIQENITVLENCFLENESKNATVCIKDNQLNLKINGPVQLSLNLQKIVKLPIDQTKKDYSVDELMLMAKFNNYEVQSSAIQTFQGFNTVKMMKGNLLPRINMGTVLEVAVDGPIGLIAAVGNLLPFLFPSNWFKVSEVKELYEAQKNSFASVRGNEMNLVEGLYFLTQRDYFVLSKFEEYVKWLKTIHLLIKQEEADLVMPKGSALFFERHIVEVEKDKILLNSGLQQELAVLAQSVGLPPLEGVKLLRVDIANIPHVTEQFDAQKLYNKALLRSFEIKTVDSLIKAAKLNVKATGYSFLDPSSSDFLGFGYASQMRVAKSEIAKLEVKKSELLSILQEELVILSNKQNEYLDSLSQYEKLKKSQKAKVSQILQMHIMGAYEDSEIKFLNDLIDESKELLGFEISYSSILFSQIVNKSKINRLILEGSYTNLDIVTPF